LGTSILSETAVPHGGSDVNRAVSHGAKYPDQAVPTVGSTQEAKRKRRLKSIKRPLPKSIKRSGRIKEVIKIEMPAVATSKTAKDFLALHCILSPEKIASFKSLFERVDVNDSNTLDKDELTQALVSMNANLSLAEVDYTMKVLELMGETGTAFTNKDTGEIELTFEQFATIAALSEKVSSLDVATKKAVNDMDFKALEQKMLKAKEIFFLYDTKNAGEIPLEDVQVILKAGRIAVEHEDEVMDQLSAQGYASLSFLDFLAYVPLFMDIHDDINTNTLTTEKRSVIQNVVSAKMLGKRWKGKARDAAKERKRVTSMAGVIGKPANRDD
jgi:Ca2+-binding EF-hand superfamily protein